MQWMNGALAARRQPLLGRSRGRALLIEQQGHLSADVLVGGGAARRPAGKAAPVFSVTCGKSIGRFRSAFPFRRNRYHGGRPSNVYRRWSNAGSAGLGPPSRSRLGGCSAITEGMQSGWSVGVLMIAMGALSARRLRRAARADQRWSWAIIGIAGVRRGGLLFLRRPFAWWIGLAVAVHDALQRTPGAARRIPFDAWRCPCRTSPSMVVGRLTCSRAW